MKVWKFPKFYACALNFSDDPGTFQTFSEFLGCSLNKLLGSLEVSRIYPDFLEIPYNNRNFLDTLGYSLNLSEAVRAEFKHLMKLEIARPLNSNWASQLHMVRKASMWKLSCFQRADRTGMHLGFSTIV